jgi:hypothetical protein
MAHELSGRSLLKLVGLAIALLACGRPVAAAQEGDPRIRTAAPSEIVGIVRVRGCSPDLSQIDLRTQPMRVNGPGLREKVDDPRAANVRARLDRTPDPHAFSFVINGLQPLTPHVLTIFVPPSPVCGTLLWRGDSSGLALSGGPRISIEGIALTTHLELYDPIGDAWVGVDHLDFTDPVAGVRTFRWRSSVPGVIRGELQISTARFPTAGEFGACDEPDSGVLYRQRLPAVQNDWSRIDGIDFHRILSPPGVVPQPDQPSASLPFVFCKSAPPFTYAWCR